MWHDHLKLLGKQEALVTQIPSSWAACDSSFKLIFVRFDKETNSSVASKKYSILVPMCADQWNTKNK
jgi:hypothetical protein